MSLLNKSKVREFALQLSAENRGGKFTRVSSEFVDRVESKLRNLIRQEIHSLPSVGVTLK